MGEREELRRQLAEWTVKWVEAENRLKNFLPDVKVEEHIKPRELEAWILTEEKWAEFQRIEKEIKEALDKHHEILDKLSRLE